MSLLGKVKELFTKHTELGRTHLEFVQQLGDLKDQAQTVNQNMEVAIARLRKMRKEMNGKSRTKTVKQRSASQRTR